jgi:hypothetical protein
MTYKKPKSTTLYKTKSKPRKKPIKTIKKPIKKVGRSTYSSARVKPKKQKTGRSNIFTWPGCQPGETAKECRDRRRK